MASANRDAEKGQVETIDNGGTAIGTSSAAYGTGASDPVSYSSRPSRIANPAPLGLTAFAGTTFILSMYNVGTRGITHPNVVVGMALFGGGLTQFMAGMWDMARGNVFGGTAFGSYGSFWMAYATIFIPGSGIISTFANPQEFNNAVGIYLITWFMITFFFLLAVLRRHLAFSVLLTTLCIAFIMLAVAEFTGSEGAQKAGGAFGLIVALIAFYISTSDMLKAELRPVVRLPVGLLHD